jgi:hypothetical protein
VAKRRGIHREHDCLLIARDRNGQTLDFHTGRGQVTVEQLHRCLKPVLPTDVLLISDGAVSYRRFAVLRAAAHVPVQPIQQRTARSRRFVIFLPVKDLAGQGVPDSALRLINRSLINRLKSINQIAPGI